MRHPNPTGFGYAESPNFNEMYVKKMAELNAADKARSTKRKPSTTKRPKPSLSRRPQASSFGVDSVE